MKKIYLGIGSDLGDRMHNLREAVRMIGESAGEVLCSSRIYETDPWGFSSESRFLNMAIEIESIHSPSDLLERILLIEFALGRIRSGKNYSSRVIDIDILFYGDEIISDGTVEIPHPRLHERRFVLVPMSDIAPGLYHPVRKRTIRELLDDCDDTGMISLYDEGCSSSA